MELTSAFMFLVGLVAIRFIFPSVFSAMSNVTSRCLMLNARPASIQHLASSIQNVASVLAPFALVMLASALVINYVQVRFRATILLFVIAVFDYAYQR